MILAYARACASPKVWRATGAGAGTQHRSRLTSIMQSRAAYLRKYSNARPEKELPDYKPVSVPVRAAVIPLGPPLLTGSSDLPGSQAGRAAPSPLFGLAPRGVYPAGGITPAAVRSYRTISPLPSVSGRRYIFCGTFRIPLGTPAVSRHAALWRPDFPPPFPEATAHPAAPAFDYLMSCQLRRRTLREIQSNLI